MDRVRRHALQQQLREHFGFDQLRPGQREVIESVMHGRHTLAIMPTGAGKSLCYQLPALALEGTTVVVSPLIALMKDQADKLDELGLPVEELNSTLSGGEQAEALARIEQEGGEFIFTTPERLGDPDFVALLKRSGVSLFVVDEAHCISQWGHDFRPAFLQLGTVIQALGEPIVLALTATATEDVVRDISQQLGLARMAVINTGIYRANLHYAVHAVTSEDEKLAALLIRLRELTGSGIVYTATVKAATEVHHALREAGIDAACYHGRMKSTERHASQDAFMSGATRVMVATNAFGMGIDKPDIRFVIHYQLPGSLQAYYQEAGRAGRDGEDALCLLLHHHKDRQIQQFFLARSDPDADELAAVHRALHALCTDGKGASARELQAGLAPMSGQRLQILLKLLKDAGLAAQDRKLRFRPTPVPAMPELLAQLIARYREKSRNDRAGLEKMVFYAQTGFCRWTVLLEHFGVLPEWNRCGHCDNCLNPPEAAYAAESEQPNAPARDVKQAEADVRLAAGTAVRVPKYGEGRVVEASSEKVTIEFADASRREFLSSYVDVI